VPPCVRGRLARWEPSGGAVSYRPTACGGSRLRSVPPPEPAARLVGDESSAEVVSFGILGANKKPGPKPGWHMSGGRTGLRCCLGVAELDVGRGLHGLVVRRF
jgi:hypothetical protein